MPISTATIASVRRARVDDVPRIVAMGLRFLFEVYRDRLPGDPDPERLTQTATWLVEGEDRAVFLVEHGDDVVGMLGLFCYTHPFTGHLVASEMFWWVEPERRGSGLRLLRAGKAWAAARGAVMLQMIAPDMTVEALYARLGYAEVETTFTTRL